MMMMPPSSAASMRFSLEKDDDDLALFNEMESRETENFLLLPSDDLEDSFCKLRHFSDTKHGISIPGDMHNAADDDDDKNDYDWLLTPPDTPLFPSLDDELDEPPPIHILSRGRPPSSKHIPISRSSSMEKSIRSSTSPCSGNSALQSRGRPSSNSSPQRKPSPSPKKAITPAARSSTPTLPRRISTGSTVSSGIRGASPVKTSRGNSASPRLRAWQTSMQSKSPTPTASRNSSSLHSHDLERVFSSRNKGPFASSGDDDLDSPQSIRVGSLDRSSSRMKSSSFTKKSARMVSQNSAPKRSFDSDKRSPQNMFRPLLSSVPSTTFYVGKANYAQLSSVTTSSNASSDHGTSFAPDTERSDHNQDDGVSETEKIFSSDIHEEVFSLDEIDILDANIGHEIINESFDNETSGPKIAAVSPTESEDSVCHVIDTELNDSSENSHVRAGISELGCLENIAACSNCGFHYEDTDQADKTIRLCPECKRENSVLTHITRETNLLVSQDSSVISANFPSEEEPLAETDQLPIATDEGDMSVLLGEQVAKENLTSSSELIHGHSQKNPLASSLVEVDQSVVDYNKPDEHSSDQQFYHSNDCPDLKADILDGGAGISVLLKRSSSSKGPLVQGRTFTATTLSYDDLSFARDSMRSFRSSTACGSYSASSSIDFSPARHSEFRVQRPGSGRKLDAESRSDIRIKRPSTGSSVSGISNHSHHGLDFAIQETTFVNTEKCSILMTDVIDSASTVSNFVEEDNLESLDCSRVTDDNSVALFPDHEVSISFDHVEDDHPNDSSSVSDTETSLKEDPESSFDEKQDAKNTSFDGMDAVVTTNCTSTITESELERENYCQNDTSLVDDDPLQEQSVPNPANDCVTEGLRVTLECEGGSSNNNNIRSMTLEEATDTILFCSSIIHDLAYQAAATAMEKDKKKSDSFECYEPTVTILGEANSDREESHVPTSGKRALMKHQKAKPRPVVETDVKSSAANNKLMNFIKKNNNKLMNDENVDESMTRIVGLPDKVDGMKPPNKLESKCNCVIM